MPLTLVLTAAGSGKRTMSFSSAPKPLIDLHGHPLIAFSLSGLPWDLIDRVIFAITPEISNYAGVDFLDRITPYLPEDMEIETCIVEEVLNGQAETVEYSIQKLKIFGPILVSSSDTWFSDNFPRDFENFDGLIGVFPSQNPSLSYVEIIDDKVVRTAEKIVISPLASSGVYFFKDASEFSIALGSVLQTSERYIAPLYNFLISKGKLVSIWETTAVMSLGTSEELTWFSSLGFPRQL